VICDLCGKQIAGEFICLPAIKGLTSEEIRAHDHCVEEIWRDEMAKAGITPESH